MPKIAAAEPPLPEPPRRTFLKKGLLGTVLLAVAGGTAVALRPGRKVALPNEPLRVLSPAEYAILSSVAARVVGAPEDAPSTRVVDVALLADRAMRLWLPSVQSEFRQLLHLFDNGLMGLATGTGMAPFTRSGRTSQEARLAAWASSRVPVFRTGYQAMKRLTVACYYSAPATWKSVGYPGPIEFTYVATPEVPDTPEAETAG